MLVLTRKSGEGIWIGDDVRVIIVEAKDGHVRLGIEAPKAKKILRDEIHERIVAENKRAAAVATEGGFLESLKSFKVGKND